MSDEYYYRNLHVVDSFTRRWANATGSSGSTYELVADARSFAYCYYLELDKRFQGDEVQLRNYYGRTLKFKLDDYLNSFYRGQTWIKKDGKHMRHTPQFASLDWEGSNGETLMDVPEGDQSLVEHDEYFIEAEPDWQGWLDVFVHEAPEHSQPMLRKLLETSLQRSKARPDLSCKHSIDLAGTAEALNMTFGTVYGSWQRAKLNFRKNHPELLEMLREQ